jgi:hypothetical protein
MNNLDIKVIRYDSTNENVEALKGQYGQIGLKSAVFTIVKNVLIINLLDGAKLDEIKLPECYDGFVQCSNGTRVQVKDSTLTCSLPSEVNGFGILTLKKWN